MEFYNELYERAISMFRGDYSIRVITTEAPKRDLADGTGGGLLVTYEGVTTPRDVKWLVIDTFGANEGPMLSIVDPATGLVLKNYRFRKGNPKLTNQSVIVEEM